MEACLFMKKYNLTEEEKAVVNKFCKYSIPYIFKSGEYCGYMQYFEFVNFEICSALLKGKRIDDKIYQMIMSQGVDIIKEKLDSYALEFFNLYLLVENIIKNTIDSWWFAFVAKMVRFLNERRRFYGWCSNIFKGMY